MGTLWLAFAATLALLVAAWLAAASVALFTANRLRLRQLARGGARGARVADELLAWPERLAVLLAMLGILARAVTVLASVALGLEWGGPPGGAAALAVATVALLLLVELLPRALAAPRAERYARRAAPTLRVAAVLLRPLVDLTLLAHRALAGALGARTMPRPRSHEELARAKPLVPDPQRQVLVEDLLQLSATVADAMVPRAEIIALDGEAEWDDVLQAIEQAPHRVLPVYRGDLDQTLGMLTIRRALTLLRRESLDRAGLISSLTPPYFVPEATPLQTQLMEFERAGRDSALVVDEYGAVLGLVTLSDVVAELARAFGAEPDADPRTARADRDGAYLVGGSVQIRSLNRTLGWELPTEGPRTVNGLLLDQLESIPAPGTVVQISGYSFEVVQASSSAVKTVRILPPAAAG